MFRWGETPSSGLGFKVFQFINNIDFNLYLFHFHFLAKDISLSIVRRGIKSHRVIQSMILLGELYLRVIFILRYTLVLFTKKGNIMCISKTLFVAYTSYNTKTKSYRNTLIQTSINKDLRFILCWEES